ncbi:cystathionine beta-synthase [Ekhidna sp. MALMAid0563]|uniref:cystathionine beta-synthase n=1 Tax=Ekhidna sp. MALMAid0563 TaxID=3143937 RepID=UPI0032DF72DB
MKENNVLPFIEKVVKNTPSDWLNLTTHRLDIYNESLAKTEFIEQFEDLYNTGNADKTKLSELPTAYDYIRLGHPLSSVLEWAIAKINGLSPDQVISFSSYTIPILAVLRKNLFDKKNTRVLYTGELPDSFDAETIRSVYGYHFEVEQVDSIDAVSAFDGSTVFVSDIDEIGQIDLHDAIDFHIGIYADMGSILTINGEQNASYTSAIQHVRRRETIAMTPVNCYDALKQLIGETSASSHALNLEADKAKVLETIKGITATQTKPLLGSSGLSVQYAIMMGLIDDARERYPEKNIKFIVPPNCYGGTNDQARRVAACLDHVEILDLPVDRENNMVDSTERVLEQVAKADTIPFIIVEIPTNPRVEVPDLEKLRDALNKKRKTASGNDAIDPVFIIDQTFCPNVQFLSEDWIFSSIRTISYVSGSKFPSGGKCTAGYCVANDQAADLMDKIEKHLVLCDNEATNLQVSILAEQMPSMNQRIQDAYINTREFVNFIQETLPAAKINFVSEELASQGFTPSVFSLDLPTKGDTEEERETYKRALNDKLIRMMITEIPNDSKYCVSYGQLKGCYWTIPATSTQGTTKESDKDYIARVSVSPDLDLEKHKAVFKVFVEKM